MEAQDQEIIPETNITSSQKFRRKGIDHTKTIELAQKGLSHSQIAKIQGCDRTNITQVLANYGIDTVGNDAYKQHRPDIFSGLQAKIISHHLSDDSIKKMPPSIAPLWFNSLYNNERLERGKSTDNIDIHGLSASNHDLSTQVRDKEAALEALRQLKQDKQ